jgi:4-hydroxybenzoate polyprenyltransferase
MPPSIAEVPGARRSVMSRLRALVRAGHPGPSLAITAMTVVLAAQAAPRGAGPVLAGPALLAAQLSIGWSNDAFDARRDAAAGRTDKPLATGEIGPRPVWTAALAAVTAALVMSLAISLTTAIVIATLIVAGWAYNAGLKSTPYSGLAYLAGFGPIPGYATSTVAGHPAPTWWITATAALLGLGGHFANVLPDLAADRATGVGGLPQRAASRWGAGAVRAIALLLLLSASVLLVVAARPPGRWVALTGLAAAVLLAVIGARSTGRAPFLTAIGIAAVDVAVLAAGAETLT